MNEVQIANLKQLAVYLRSGLKPGTKFDMRSFSEPGISTSGTYRTDCGSVGCAVGHGPYAGIPKLSDENWHTYCERVFGLEEDLPEWDWLFGERWALTKYRDPISTADRIDELLSDPDLLKTDYEDFSEQMSAYLDLYS